MNVIKKKIGRSVTGTDFGLEGLSKLVQTSGRDIEFQADILILSC